MINTGGFDDAVLVGFGGVAVTGTVGQPLHHFGVLVCLAWVLGATNCNKRVGERTRGRLNRVFQAVNPKSDGPCESSLFDGEDLNGKTPKYDTVLRIIIWATRVS